MTQVDLKNKAVYFLFDFRSTYDPQAAGKADHRCASHPTTGFGHVPVTLWGAGDKEMLEKCLQLLEIRLTKQKPAGTKGFQVGKT